MPKAKTSPISKEQLELQKLADTKYPIEEILRHRCSTLAFSDRPVGVDKLQQLFEAARWAASSYNEQPWSFLLTTKRDNPEDYERLLSSIAALNRTWAHRAPVLVLAVAKRHFDAGGTVNHYAFHDVGMAVENLSIQATALGLFVHVMAGFSAGEARRLFEVPETHEPVSVLAIGYFGGLESLPVELQKREMASRTRRPFRDFVFSGRWGKASDLVPD